MQDIGFDIIGDLHLDSDEGFSWTNKATSLYCIVTGNISSDMATVVKVLVHLSTQYQGVFFTPGKLEYESTTDFAKRSEELGLIAEGIPNMCMLHQHVAVIDGIAILGTNGWGDIENQLTRDNIMRTAARLEDFAYLRKSISKLQRHLDVKKIVLVTSAIPHDELYFGEKPSSVNDHVHLYDALESDTEHKVTHWVFGSYSKPVVKKIDQINFLNNPRMRSAPYWAKRLTITI